MGQPSTREGGEPIPDPAALTTAVPHRGGRLGRYSQGCCGDGRASLHAAALRPRARVGPALRKIQPRRALLGRRRARAEATDATFGGMQCGAWLPQVQGRGHPGSASRSRGFQCPAWRGGGGGDGGVFRRWAVLLCIGSFCLGLLFTNRMWTLPDENEIG
ncbi:unnamed protein product [Urochloa humidicola]